MHSCRTVEAVVAFTTAALAAGSGTRWVGIDGLGGSGKTTLADAIAAALPGAVVVHNDDFARPDLPQWDRERFVRQVVAPLRSGRPGRYQRWDFDADRGAEWHQVPRGVPVIVEGVSATDERLPVPWDLTIWIEVPAQVRRARIAERDGPARHQRWVRDWIPSEQAYVAAQRPQDRADLVYRPQGPVERAGAAPAD